MRNVMKIFLLILLISIHFHFQDAACCGGANEDTNKQSDAENPGLNSGSNNPDDGGTIPDSIFAFDPFLA
ncbi:unnamed protein product [Schistosoma turkestanicum]|nr:unnamed protein product [Schistosoma turkestanicum]